MKKMKFSTIYQNSVLSLILICLVVIIIQNQNDTNSAKGVSYPDINQSPKTILTNNTSSNFNNFALVPVNEDGSINVKVLEVSNTLDVNIEDISTSDKLNIHLKSSDSYSLNYAGPIEVEVND